MKRILRLSTLAGAIVAAALLPSLSPVSPQAANAGPYYYGGGYAPGYGGYPRYGYSPYGYGGYTYNAPRAYVYPVYPSYRSYGFGNGFGTGATYYGMYAQPYARPYHPYGYGVYGPYRY